MIAISHRPPADAVCCPISLMWTIEDGTGFRVDGSVRGCECCNDMNAEAITRCFESETLWVSKKINESSVFKYCIFQFILNSVEIE